MGGMGIVPAERLEAELPMHEDDCIVFLQKVFSGSCASGA